MPLVDNAWYVNFGDGATTGYYAITAWAAAASKVTGDIVRQLAAPAVASERSFVCIASTGGTGQTGGAEPAWTLTRGAKTTDNTVTWQEASGQACLNGDKTNTPTWTTIKGTAIVLGQVIKSDNSNFILICTTAGTAGSGAEPSWSAYTAAGATTADNTVTWTTLKDSGNNYTAWINPFARLAGCCAATWQGAGDFVYVSSAHQETIGTGAAYGVNIQTSVNTATYVISVNPATAPPTARQSGASVTNTASANVATGFSNTGANGVSFVDGISVTSSTGNASGLQVVVNAQNTVSSVMVFRNATLTYRGTGPGVTLIGSQSFPADTFIESCTLSFTGNPSTSPNVTLRGRGYFRNCSFTFGVSQPSQLIATPALSFPCDFLFEGCDFTAYTGGQLINNNVAVARLRFKDCAFSSGTNQTQQTNIPSVILELIRSDSANTGYRTLHSDDTGTCQTSTSTVRTGGASDGTTPISWTMVTNSSATFAYPCLPPPISIWVSPTGATVNVTIFAAGSTIPTDKELQFDVAYLGSNTTSLGTVGRFGPTDILATGTNWTTDAVSTWSGAPANKFKATFSFVPQKAGYIFIYLRQTKASATYFIDPLPVLS